MSTPHAHDHSESTRLGIVGMGEVGAAIGYASMIRGVANQYVLHDVNADKRHAHSLDLAHGQAFCPPCEILEADSLAELEACDIVAITAGAKQKPGQSRLELAGVNAGLLRDIVPGVIEACPDSVLLIVTNPVDVLTMIAREIAVGLGFDEQRIIGSGTVLDTARLRFLLSRRLRIAPTNIHASIVGEHGDSEIALWSSATVGGMALSRYRPTAGESLDDEEQAQILQSVRDAAGTIIRGKGATSQAIGVCSARICEAIFRDERAVLTVSTTHERIADESIEPTCFSMPTIIGRYGVVRVIDEIPLSDDERAGLSESARTIRENHRSVTSG